MCFDICTINIRVSIRVRALHLVSTQGVLVLYSAEFPLFEAFVQVPEQPRKAAAARCLDVQISERQE